MIKNKIYDVFTFNGEYDLLDLHLNILAPHVDEFVICEASLTFTGKPKPLYFEAVKDKYAHLPIKYYVIDENDHELWEMARNSPNTSGAEHWKREFVHKESIKKALTHLKDDDLVFVGDCDEIWSPLDIEPTHDTVFKLELSVYTYYLNLKSTEQFFGTIVTRYKNLKEKCLNHLRSTENVKYANEGFHFTSMGGIDALKKKLGDQYTEESYWNKDVQDKLESRFGHADFLGRGFSYRVDESEWSTYLKENRQKYQHLCLP